MRQRPSLKAVLCGASVLLLALSTLAPAQQFRRGGLYGDWDVTVDYDGRQMQSILAFSRDREGNRTGQWISFWGLTELQDVKIEEGQVSFAWTRQNREGQSTTTTFTGKIEEGKLTGTLSSDRGQYALTGQRSPRMPRAAGRWDMKLQMGERQRTATLTVTADKEGNLAAQWKSERGEPELSDVQYSRGELSFKMKSGDPDRQWEAAFAGNIEGDTLSGKVTSQRGEMTTEGKRIGAPLIGTWNLDVTSERGTRKQRLRVNADMTGLYGARPIEKINLEGDQVSFKIVLQFGDRSFEMDFAGKVTESKLTGELTTSRGSQKVVGTKVVRTFRRPSAR